MAAESTASASNQTEQAPKAGATNLLHHTSQPILHPKKHGFHLLTTPNTGSRAVRGKGDGKVSKAGLWGEGR